MKTPTARTATTRMRDLAAWWDQFATATVTDLPRVIGAERADAARARRRRRCPGGPSSAPSSNDIGVLAAAPRGVSPAPAAFAQVIEPLIATAGIPRGDGSAHDVALGGRNRPPRRGLGLV